MTESRLMTLVTAINRMGRPYLTILIATLYNVALLVAVATGALKVSEYIVAVGPTNSMIIGFWFGERAAMKKAPEDKPE